MSGYRILVGRPGYLPDATAEAETFEEAREALEDELARTTDAHGGEDATAAAAEEAAVKQARTIGPDGGGVTLAGYWHAIVPTEEEDG